MALEDGKMETMPEGTPARLLGVDAEGLPVLSVPDAVSAAAAQSYAAAASEASGLLVFPSVSSLVTDDNDVIGYASSGAEVEVIAGAIVSAQNFRYSVAAADVSDHHIETAGGVKLYVLPGTDGAANVMAFGVDNTGTTDETAKLNLAIQNFSLVRIPPGTYKGNLNATANVAIVGEGRDITILQQNGTGGVTLTINADVELRNLTLKCHETNTASKTIVHIDDHFVRARDVYFYGINHQPSGGVDAAGEFRACEFYTTADTGFGAYCWSAKAAFWNSKFMGYKGCDVYDATFYDCVFGTSDITTLCAHLPSGGTLNNGSPSGYAGQPVFHNPIMRSAGSGLTCGNDAHPIIINPDIIAASQAIYARSNSTHRVKGGRLISTAGTAAAYSKTSDVNSLGISGESVLVGVYIEGLGTSPHVDLSVPPLGDSYPASIGNVRLIDCTLAHVADSISPNTSTYPIFESRKKVYRDTAIFANNGETKRIQFKGMEMSVAVYGSDAAKTGCFLSHLDRLTGQPLPYGMVINVIYGGVSSRFITFASGVTGDGGRMDFVGGASTLATTQQGLFRFVLIETGWRQI